MTCVGPVNGKQRATGLPIPPHTRPTAAARSTYKGIKKSEIDVECAGDMTE